MSTILSDKETKTLSDEIDNLKIYVDNGFQSLSHNLITKLIGILAIVPILYFALLKIPKVEEKTAVLIISVIGIVFFIVLLNIDRTREKKKNK